MSLLYYSCLTCVSRRIGRVLGHIYALGYELVYLVELYVEITDQSLYVLVCDLTIAVST